MQMNSFQEFTEIDWLNSYFSEPESAISPESIQPILYFSLMWNMFESLACKKFATISTIESKVNEIFCKDRLHLKDFSPFLNYFQERYLTDGNANELFNTLNFRSNDKKEIVVKVLKGDLDDINNIVLALLLITYRLRNNLFHGVKNIYRLEYQVDNFVVANQILATFLNQVKGNSAGS